MIILLVIYRFFNLIFMLTQQSKSLLIWRKMKTCNPYLCTPVFAKKCLHCVLSVLKCYIFLHKVSQQCVRKKRTIALQSQKTTKETLSRARRLTREMLIYWKRFEKVEKEHRKKAEKEAQEQRKHDLELMEVGMGKWFTRDQDWLQFSVPDW